MRQCRALIAADFAIRIDNYLLSGLQITPDNVVSAWGRRIDTNDSVIRKQSRIAGNIHIEPQRITQAHEHVGAIQRIERQMPPDERVQNLR